MNCGNSGVGTSQERLRAVEKVAVVSRVGDFLDIRTGKQEFVEKKGVYSLVIFN